jgi:hypothetical protein
MKLTCLCLLVLSLATGSALAGEPAEAGLKAKSLFCMTGGVSMVPVPTPPDFEGSFAVVVVEITSPQKLAGASVSNFAIIDDSGQPVKPRRIVSVEVFARPRTSKEGEYAYYLNPGGTTPWDGTLPAGTIRLRIKASLKGDPNSQVNRGYHVQVGPAVIEGAWLGIWPT